MRKHLLGILGLCPMLLFAQLQNHNWYFSPTTRGIHFDNVTNVPSVVLGHSPLMNLHGCGVASDPVTGNVLFYTDGATVFDASNVSMPYGTGLSSGTSCAQKGRIALVPGSCDRYYVFCNTANDPASGNLYYTIVNMSLVGNGTVALPKGDVENTSLNVYITNLTTEAFEIVANPLNGNYWLLVPSNASSNIRIYSVTSSGVTYVSTFSTGISIAGSFALKYSKEAGKLAYVSVVENEPALLMNFNSSTGVISGVTTVPGTPVGTNTGHFYGWHDVEFSPDGSKLYISKYRMFSPAASGRIYQYDLNMPASPVTPVFSIPSTDISKNCTGLQTGPDGKIYFIYHNLTYADDRLIGCISDPDSAGAACNVNPTALDLGIAQSNNTRFPEFVDYSVIRVLPANGSAAGYISCQLNYAQLSIYNPEYPESITLLGTANGTSAMVGDSIHYSSDPGFLGNDTIFYQYCDPSCFSFCDTGYVFVSVMDDCTTGLIQNDGNRDIQVFPDPSNGDFTVRCGSGTIEITDVTGKRIYFGKTENGNNRVELYEKRSGVYFLKWTDMVGRNLYKKFVITH